MPRGRALCAWIVAASALGVGARADGLQPLSEAPAPGPVDGAEARSPGVAREPSLHEASAAAARVAAGGPQDDEQRLSRARRSRWLPVLKAQVGGSDAQRLKADPAHGYLTLDDGSASSLNWLVSASWDLSQLWYAKEEVALTLSSARLERLRQAAAARVAHLYTRRQLLLGPPGEPEAPAGKAPPAPRAPGRDRRAGFPHRRPLRAGARARPDSGHSDDAVRQPGGEAMNDVRVETGAKVWVLAIACAVLFAAAWTLGGCGRAVGDRVADDGRLHIKQVVPATGAVDAEASFRVEFSAPMDASLLLSDVDRSETVALVLAADTERALAALGRAHPTERERELFVPARAELSPDLRALVLTPQAPLAPGDWALVVSGRLSDLAGRPLESAARFLYSVEALPPAPALLSPLAGAEAPLNLMTVRVAFPHGAPGEVVTLEGPDGTLAVALAPEGAGVAELSLCKEAPCERLVPGKTYRVLVGGEAVVGAAFKASSCSREDPVAVRGVDVRARDTWADVAIQLDGPGALRVEVAEDQGASPAGVDDQAFERLCAGGACREAAVLVRCAPSACGAAAGDACQETVRVPALLPGKAYLLRVRGQDDEGRPVTSPVQRFSTTQVLPAVALTEVMASPSGPEPRSDGEFVEIWNPGPGAVDAASLLLAGPTARPTRCSGRLRPRRSCSSPASARWWSARPSTPPATTCPRASCCCAPPASACSSTGSSTTRCPASCSPRPCRGVLRSRCPATRAAAPSALPREPRARLRGACGLALRQGGWLSRTGALAQGTGCLPSPWRRWDARAVPGGAPALPRRSRACYEACSRLGGLRPVANVRVLGIDPGSRFCGVGVVEDAGGGRVRHVHHAVIVLDPKAALDERLLVLGAALDRVLAEQRPAVVVVEEVFHGKNARSALVLGHARGVALLTARRAGAELRSYPTAVIKQAVTGNGRADKTQVARMVCALLGIELDGVRADASDALAAALCGVLRAGVPKAAQPGAQQAANAVAPGPKRGESPADLWRRLQAEASARTVRRAR